MTSRVNLTLINTQKYIYMRTIMDMAHIMLNPHGFISDNNLANHSALFVASQVSFNWAL